MGPASVPAIGAASSWCCAPVPPAARSPRRAHLTAWLYVCVCVCVCRSLPTTTPFRTSLFAARSPAVPAAQSCAARGSAFSGRRSHAARRLAPAPGSKENQKRVLVRACSPCEHAHACACASQAGACMRACVHACRHAGARTCADPCRHPHTRGETARLRAGAEHAAANGHLLQ